MNERKKDIICIMMFIVFMYFFVTTMDSFQTQQVVAKQEEQTDRPSRKGGKGVLCYREDCWGI